MSTGGGLLFSWAYARAEAGYLAVTEYSGFLWASALGWLIFRERVSLYTLAGAVLIVGGCLIAVPARGAARDGHGLARGGRAEHVDGERKDADVEREGREAVNGHDLADVLVLDHHVGGRERHSTSEGEIDGVPVERARWVPGNSRPEQLASGLAM